MQKSDLEMQLFELDVLSACRSSHICQIIDKFEDYRHFYIVQEHIDGINLNEYYFKHSTNERRIKMMMLGIA